MSRPHTTNLILATYRVLTDVATTNDWRCLEREARDHGPTYVRDTVQDVLAYHRPAMTPVERYGEATRVLRQLGV